MDTHDNTKGLAAVSKSAHQAETVRGYVERSGSPTRPQASATLTTAHRDLDALDRVAAELARARDERPAPLHSAHEGYAVLAAAAEDLWCLVRSGDNARTKHDLAVAALRVAAIAARFVVDVADRANPVTDDFQTVMGQMDRAVDEQLAAKEQPNK